jgi:hypothetical protein
MVKFCCGRRICLSLALRISTWYGNTDTYLRLIILKEAPVNVISVCTTLFEDREKVQIVLPARRLIPKPASYSDEEQSLNCKLTGRSKITISIACSTIACNDTATHFAGGRRHNNTMNRERKSPPSTSIKSPPELTFHFWEQKHI